MPRDEYERNLEAIKRAYPEEKLLSQRQMAEYLGTSTRTLRQFGIDGRITVESFAMRLTKGKE